MDAEEGRTSSRPGLRGELLAPNGYLHAATVVALAGTSCGHGTFANLPDGAERFTTIGLESNFLGTARRGAIECKARRVHGGRTAQVWYATVTGQEKTIALPHCAQMILHPR